MNQQVYKRICNHHVPDRFWGNLKSLKLMTFQDLLLTNQIYRVEIPQNILTKTHKWKMLDKSIESHVNFPDTSQTKHLNKRH
jgi:hypothetical protein